LSFQISSDFKEIPPLVNEVINTLKEESKNENLTFNIKVSLTEALVNAIKHGNKFNQNLKVEVKLTINNESATIEVKDEGKGFNHGKSSSYPENLLSLSGRGLYLIKNLMDKEEFLENGKVIRMTKKIPRNGGQR